MSSANRNASDLVSSGRSFIYSTKSNGPITEPCIVTLCHFDSLIKLFFGSVAAAAAAAAAALMESKYENCCSICAQLLLQE